MCHEAQDGEYDKAGIHAGRTVGDADDDAVSVCRIKRRENMWGINSTGKQMRYICNLTPVLLSLCTQKTFSYSYIDERLCGRVWALQRITVGSLTFSLHFKLTVLFMLLFTAWRKS